MNPRQRYFLISLESFSEIPKKKKYRSNLVADCFKERINLNKFFFSTSRDLFKRRNGRRRRRRMKRIPYSITPPSPKKIWILLFSSCKIDSKIIIDRKNFNNIIIIRFLFHFYYLLRERKMLMTMMMIISVSATDREIEIFSPPRMKFWSEILLYFNHRTFLIRVVSVCDRNKPKIYRCDVIERWSRYEFLQHLGTQIDSSCILFGAYSTNSKFLTR